jgi:tetratricopeptide (TPR) repeat protein
MALASQGEYEPALRILRDTLDTGERVGAWQVRSRVVNTIGWVFAELEDHEQALEWNRAGVALAGSIAGLPDPEIEFNARLNLADNLVALGQPDAAEQEFKTVEAVVRNPTPAQRWLLWRYSLHLFASYGELWLDRGHPSKALAYADECLHLGGHSTSRNYVVRGRRLRGQRFWPRAAPTALSRSCAPRWSSPSTLPTRRSSGRPTSRSATCGGRKAGSRRPGGRMDRRCR